MQKVNKCFHTHCYIDVLSGIINQQDAVSCKVVSLHIFQFPFEHSGLNYWACLETVIFAKLKKGSDFALPFTGEYY